MYQKMIEMRNVCLKLAAFFIAVSSPVAVVGIGADGGCPVSAKIKGHENQDWSHSDGYHLTDGCKDLPRVLLVGDSICNAYREGVRRTLEGRMNVTYWASSYCVTSRGYLTLLGFYLDEARYAVVHFNNGLHSLDTDLYQWEEGLRAAFRLIRKKQPQATIVWRNITPLKDVKMTERVVRMNAMAEKVAKEVGDIIIDDLFTPMNALDREKDWADTFHFHPSAVRHQEKHVSDLCLKIVGR